MYKPLFLLLEIIRNIDNQMFRFVYAIIKIKGRIKSIIKFLNNSKTAIENQKIRKFEGQNYRANKVRVVAMKSRDYIFIKF